MPAGDRVSCGDLLELLTSVSDGRQGQGRDHPVPAVLALAAGAVVAGMRSFTAIAGWAADAPAGVVAELYQRCGAARPAAGPPSKSTIWRVVTGADAPALDAVTEGQYPAVARGRGLTATDTGRRPTATSRTQFDPASGSRTRGRAEHRYLGPSGGAFTRVVEVPVPTPRQPVDSAVPEDTSTGAVPL